MSGRARRGHRTHGFGITAALTNGAAVGAVVTGEAPGFPVEAFALWRFEGRSTEFGSSYIAGGAALVGPDV